MPASTRSGARVLITAVILLLATFLGVQCASAQVTAETLRSPGTASASTDASNQRPSTAEEDVKPRHGPRRSISVQAQRSASARVCDCDLRTVTAHCFAQSVTERECARRGRAVDLHVLHQTFRC
jgi:hypothetical protein